MNPNVILKQLSWEEKAALVAGCDFMYTNPIPRLQIPSVQMSDGPHGLRIQSKVGNNGVAESESATCFPTAAASASSWNPENTYKMGKAIGKEAHHYGVDVVLGPAVNIKRNPLGGRCFEYFSEDPFLSGEMGTSAVLGIQSEGVGVAVKHFALNNNENYRFMGDSIADERAIREIYLKPFERIVRNAHPETVMCAYNKINGTYCSENEWLLTKILRNEWGFDGLVMTDWGATHDRLKMLRAGLDLEMPGDTPICRKWILDGLASGALDEAVLDQAVSNVLSLVAKHENQKKEKADFEAHHELAKEIAIDSAVLLKNDGMLPLEKKQHYFVCGELFEKARYQGSGSSLIKPAKLSTPKSAFDAAGVHYTYAKGYRENQIECDEAVLAEAIAVSQTFENVIVFAGLTDYVEGEGFDRADMKLCSNQLMLVEALVKMGKNITVVLYGGSPVELPFSENVNAILNMYLPGQNGGEAARELLFGDANPAGRLAETWPMSYTDVPFGDHFSKGKNEIYKESVFVGYRYYLTAGEKVRYPFGYGLSYTSFAYSEPSLVVKEDTCVVSCTVKNVGTFNGAEVVQLYVGAPANEIFRPVRELKGFSKVYLKAGESKRVTISVSRDDLKYWNIRGNAFVLEKGTYRFELCSDCETVRLAISAELDGEENAVPYSKEVLAAYQNAALEQVTDAVFEEILGRPIPTEPSKMPIHIESRFSDLKDSTWMGKFLYNCVLMVAKIDRMKAERIPEGVQRDNKIKSAIMMQNILNSNSLCSMTMCSTGLFPYNIAEAFVEMANGKFFSGIRKLCTWVKVPPLPRKNKNKKNG